MLREVQKWDTKPNLEIKQDLIQARQKGKRKKTERTLGNKYEQTVETRVAEGADWRRTGGNKPTRKTWHVLTVGVQMRHKIGEIATACATGTDRHTNEQSEQSFSRRWGSSHLFIFGRKEIVLFFQSFLSLNGVESCKVQPPFSICPPSPFLTRLAAHVIYSWICFRSCRGRWKIVCTTMRFWVWALPGPF